MNSGNDVYEFIAARAASDGWQVKNGADGELIIKTCPFCKNENNHFYLNTKRDGAPYHCQRCKVSGNLLTLKRHLNIDVGSAPSGFTRLGNVGEFSRLRSEEPKKTLVKNFSRKTDYNGNVEYFYCGDTECGLELQSRVDSEDMFGAMWTIRQGLDWNQARWAKNHRGKVHQDNPYTKMMKDMNQTRLRIEHFFEEAEFDPEWVADEQ